MQAEQAGAQAAPPQAAAAVAAAEASGEDDELQQALRMSMSPMETEEAKASFVCHCSFCFLLSSSPFFFETTYFV